MKRSQFSRPIETVSGSCKIDMRFMLKNKLIRKNELAMGVLEWTEGQAVSYECNMKEEEKYLRLKYLVTSRGQEIKYDYRIYIDEVMSNLGRGTILYFICPESGKRSRVLISAYGEPRFLNREYYRIKYSQRVYYGCQQTSKDYYHNTRYFDLKRKVEKLKNELNQKHRNSHYRGELTKDQVQLNILVNKMNYHNLQRAKQLRESLERKGIKLR